ncbi:adenylate/guanylate cyclase domain-containing protein [Comamonas odontotermitis]|uniref:adenylate/guanylate cyclase domain-containing protein n=1 Tax=Comamonas odontotermitis TaxID=379895 RepID=UPI001CC4CFF6|nr:adenylate/guanylate cyclase domain-containing protein [Comamonas odontotermitis]UBB18700.1 adenylate/guanylate cyclase domain-containing protein [Comamonas odontotermitis]
MTTVATVVFIDISGSTALFETLGNERAARAVAGMTDAFKQVVVQAGGRVVKTLGDGVLAIFNSSGLAVSAMTMLMRRHYGQWDSLPPTQKFHVRVGMSTGEVVLMEGDCYGDSVNMASRLCEKASHREIWASASTMESGSRADTTFVPMGWMEVRGKSEQHMLYQVQWSDLEAQEVITAYDSSLPMRQETVVPVRLRLASGGVERVFETHEMPIFIGRSSDSEWVVLDRRVSRQHGRIDWRGGNLIFTDLSRYGTWLTFGSSPATVVRRETVQLHGAGVMYFGVSPEDPTAPSAAFSIKPV